MSNMDALEYNPIPHVQIAYRLYKAFRPRRRKPPPPQYSIPQFPYPENILTYLKSQSIGYSITYKPHNGSNLTLLEYSLDDTNEYDGIGYESIPEETENEDISTPTSTPTINIQPAYSEPTYTPTTPPTITIPPVPYISPTTPVIWKAAINSMIYIQKLNLPITTNDKINIFYNDLHKTLTKMLLDSGTDGPKNAAALIYFCTVTTEVFKPFNEFISYNYLNSKYPTIFSDSKAYRKFCMINEYCIQSSKLFNKHTILKKHIPEANRMMKYMVSPILNSVISLLQNNNNT